MKEGDAPKEAPPKEKAAPKPKAKAAAKQAAPAVNDSSLLGITAKKEENFADWYSKYFLVKMALIITSDISYLFKSFYS